MYRQIVVFYLVLKTIKLVRSEADYSQSHYEEKTLKKMIKQELIVEKKKSEIEVIKHRVLECLKYVRDETNNLVVELVDSTRDTETIKDKMGKAARDFESRNEENTRTTHRQY